MESKLNILGISVGDVVMDNHTQVSNAVLVYCERLVDYLMSMESPTLITVITMNDVGQQLVNNICNSNSNGDGKKRDVLQQAIANSIHHKLLEERTDHFYEDPGNPGLALGLGILPEVLSDIIDIDILEQVASTLSYAIYECKMRDEHLHGDWRMWDGDFLARPFRKVLTLPSPTNQNLIDGILLSEEVALRDGPIIYCLCVEGVVLWPSIDARITIIPDHYNMDVDRFKYRIKPATVIAGSYTRLHPYNRLMPRIIEGYMVFDDPLFLQGIKTMDMLLPVFTRTGSQRPSYNNLEIYHQGQWVPATDD